MYDPERAFGVEAMDDREVRERRANMPSPETQLVMVEQRTEAETASLALAMGGLAMMLAPEAPIRQFEYRESVVAETEEPETSESNLDLAVEQISHVYEKPDTEQALTRAAYELAA